MVLKASSAQAVVDRDTGRTADVVQRSDGKNALATDARVIVESTFGFDPLPDSWFQIINAGQAGDTITIYIAGTMADPSVPDSDVPAFSRTFTVLAGEAGDEIALRDRIITELNTDSTFRDSCYLKAFDVTDRAIIHISSEKFSLSGEFWERPNVGDFDVTYTGSVQINIGFDNFTSRSKPISISRDPDSPHNLGVFGISGTVNVQAKDLDDLFIENAVDGNGSPDMTVNGSMANPVDFFVNASVVTDIFVEEIRFYGQGNGITYKNFMSLNQPLTNGIEVEIKSDNTITTLPIIKTTADFKNKFAFGRGAGGFSLDIASGRDDFLAVFTFNNPFIIKVKDSFGAGNDDYIRVRIRDNINVAELEFIAKGFEKEP